MLIGLLAFKLPSRSKGGMGGEMGEAEAKLKLIQGLPMSDISAGMLIYASCVEMLGGDFVFGSVGEGHGHGHGGGRHWGWDVSLSP
jgi:solute carrier family 39 (zinc transporter), member 1/2/3